MVRKLKYHEQKLLKKVDFINWEVDNNLHEVKVLRKYHIEKREDYTKWVKSVMRCLGFDWTLRRSDGSDEKAEKVQVWKNELYTKTQANENQSCYLLVCR